MANPDLVLCRKVVIRSARQSISPQVREEASACPNPANPRSSMKSALSLASPLKGWARTSATMALNSSTVAVLRIGLASFDPLRLDAGDEAIIPSPTAISQRSFTAARWRLRDAAPNLYLASHSWTSDGLIFPMLQSEPPGQSALIRLTMAVFRTIVCWYYFCSRC